MFKNTSDSYGSIAKLFHWLMALAIIILLIVGYSLSTLKMPVAYKIHKTFGFMVLVLAVARILWRFSNITPGYGSNMPKWMGCAAHLFHYCLYALMITVPLSAFIASNAAQYPISFMFLFDMPLIFSEKNIQLAKASMQLHRLGAFILACFVGIHFLIALYHNFIRKDNILTRMWISKKSDN